MARTRRTTTCSLKEELFGHPYRFQFFQAVRLLHILYMRLDGDRGPGDVGGDLPPDREHVRFKGTIAHQFPAAECTALTENHTATTKEPKQLSVSVMGLYGAMGVLPLHDTQRLIDARRDSPSEKAFLDLFNHRVLSLFYRAWAKHSLPFNYEQSFGRFSPASRGSRTAESAPADPISDSLLCLAGLGIPPVRGRLSVPDTAITFFAGHFSRQPKSESALRQMIQHLFCVRVKILQFVGQWLQLDETSRSEMATPDRPDGQNCQLGRGFVLGDRAWDVSSKFRILLGPLTYEQMLAFSPLGSQLRRLSDLARTYVGVQLDFDVQLELLAEEIPRCQLSGEFALGVNGWLYSQSPSKNAVDAVFQPQV